MNSRSAALPMVSPLIRQRPRRSSDSQPKTAGTFGHFARLRATISSTVARIFPGGDDVRNRGLPGEALARALPGGPRDGGGAPQVGAPGIRRGGRPRPRQAGGGVLWALDDLRGAAGCLGAARVRARRAWG